MRCDATRAGAGTYLWLRSCDSEIGKEAEDDWCKWQDRTEAGSVMIRDCDSRFSVNPFGWV